VWGLSLSAAFSAYAMRMEMQIQDVTVCQDSKEELRLDGCERKTDLQCGHDINVRKDWFLRIPEVYLPMHPLRLQVEQSFRMCKSACSSRLYQRL
jgi:hypothetical protein